MSAVLQAREPDARYLATRQPALLENFDLLATAPGGVARLRELILTLAVRGKLVPQDPADEPASRLLERIRAEKGRLVKEGKIRKEKPLAEIIDEERPFELPIGWIWIHLGEISSYIQRGKSPTYADHSDHRVVSQKCVRWYGLDLEPARLICPESLGKYEEIRFLQLGDLLWNSTGTGTIGRACLVPAKLINNRLVTDSHVTVVRPLLINSAYLWRWIQSPCVQNEIEGAASGTTNQIELTTSAVVSQVVPLPPLLEQSRIVARVDELMQLCDALEARGRLEAEQHARLTGALFDALAASESAHALAENWHRVAAHFDLLLDRPEAVDALEQTILQLAVRGLLVPQDPTDEPASVLLQEIRAEKDRLIAAGKIKRDKPLPPIADEETPFELPRGWEWARAEAVLSLLNGYAFRSECFKPSGIRLLRNINVSHGELDWSQAAHLDCESAQEFDRFLLEVGDIVLSLDRPLISTGLKYAVVREEDLPCLLLQRVAKLSPARRVITPPFVELWLQSELFTTAIDPGRSNGVPHISTKQVEGMLLPIPPIPEQSRIVDRVTELRSLCAALRQRLAAARQTQSRLAEALADSVSA